MARLPRLFQTRSSVPNKDNPADTNKDNPADITVSGIISGDFPFYIENGWYIVHTH